MKEYTYATKFLDFDHEVIQSFIETHTDSSMSNSEKAVSIYTAVRDGWRYTARILFFKEEAWVASNIMLRDEGHCLDKSIILTACLRGAGIPARMHLAKVKNHIAAEHFMEKFGTDELTPHGMVDVYLNNRWIKISPAFNKGLCQKLNVDPLDFDGAHDSIFQQYDRAGGQFMEYLEDYGDFEDVPLKFIYNNFREHYSGLRDRIDAKGVLSI